MVKVGRFPAYTTNEDGNDTVFRKVGT